MRFDRFAHEDGTLREFPAKDLIYALEFHTRFVNTVYHNTDAKISLIATGHEHTTAYLEYLLEEDTPVIIRFAFNTESRAVSDVFIFFENELGKYLKRDLDPKQDVDIESTLSFKVSQAVRKFIALDSTGVEVAHVILEAVEDTDKFLQEK